MSLLQSLRRHLRSPAFALTVFALVGAVTAINATVFGAIDMLRWKSLPYAADDSLVTLQLKLTKIDNESNLSERYRKELARDTATFRGVAGFVSSTRSRSDDEGRPWRIALATPQLDSVLDVSPALGRGIADADAHDGADRVLVISDALWRRRFHADPEIVGRTVRFGDRIDTIVGVMPRNFAFPDTQTDAWRPFVPPAQKPSVDGVGELDVVARLAEGATLAQARLALDRVYDDGKALGDFAAMFANMGPQAHVEPWREHFHARHGQALALLQLAALVLLLVVAANLVNLQLDRLLGRRREFDIRRALGAGEGAIAAQALRDIALPAGAGIAAGLVLAEPGMHLLALRHLLPETMPAPITFSVAMLGSGAFIAVVASTTALLAARLSRGRATLSARGGAAGLGRLRPTLLVGQVVLTTALLGSAILLLRSAVNVLDIDRGFDERGVLMAGIDFTLASPARRQPMYDPRGDVELKSAMDELLARAKALPGVRHVATTTIAPFSGGDSFSQVQVPGQIEPQQLRERAVSAGYFATLGIALHSGRVLDARDTRGDGGSNAVVVDEQYVQRYLGGRDSLDASVGIDAGPDGSQPTMAPIVGVVANVKNNALDEKADVPTIYRITSIPSPMFVLLVRADVDAASLVEPVRRLIQQVAPDAAIAFNQPLAQRVATSFAARRGLLETIGMFAAMTLALASIGLAAVLGFSIRRRTAELGVRLAIGATPARVRNLVLRQGGMLVITGLAFGTALGIVLARLLADRLFGIGYADPASWSIALALIAGIALFACWLPAQRASRIDPVAALHDD
ncbi:FtsX-like permease family protein [Dokdonella sp.]|uniref:FtsX-like permease family protein n=1 Tax=Dokdonella sp. TaxID=2291710 RepID=UPI002601CE2C|nr:FtsX-like permease family protein [Dokdonella sp.]